MNLTYNIKPIDKGFIVVHAEGAMSGCNAAPGAKVFPTQAHAETAIDIIKRFDAFEFDEEYNAATRLH